MLTFAQSPIYAEQVDGDGSHAAPTNEQKVQEYEHFGAREGQGPLQRLRSKRSKTGETKTKGPPEKIEDML